MEMVGLEGFFSEEAQGKYVDLSLQLNQLCKREESLKKQIRSASSMARLPLIAELERVRKEIRRIVLLLS